MEYTEKTQRTSDLNLHCKNDVRKIVLKIEGVDSIDKDLELSFRLTGEKKDKDLELNFRLTEKKRDKDPERNSRLTEKKEDKDRLELNFLLTRKKRDKDPEPGKATISGNVDPQTAIKKKDRAKKHPELLGKEEERPPKINHQEKQIVLHQNPVRIHQRKEAPQTPGLTSKSVRKHCDPKHDHDHELELKSYNKPFKCNKCREDGFTSGYRCKHCIYDLHKGCWKPKHEITPDLFPGSIFKFSKKTGKICDACGMEIHGHSYSCEKDKLDLHPACSKLPGKLPISRADFVLCKCKEVKYECFFCKKKKPRWFAETQVTGLCYVLEHNTQKKFSCHVHCLYLVIQEAWKKGRGDLDRNNDYNDAISRALGKVDLKPVVTAKGSDGEGGGLFLKTVTIFLKTIISILFGDPTGLIVFGLTELVKGLLTL